MIKLGRNRIIAATGTLVAHIVVMILLLCSTLSSTIATPEEDRGVYIQLGTIDEASGTFRPYYPEPVTEQGAQETVVEEQLITQNSEESVVIENNTASDDAPAQPTKDNKVGSLVHNAFSGSEQMGGSGDGESGDGVQGASDGRPSGSVTGVSDGNRANLRGRTSLDLPRPSYNSNVEGTVVVNITVNKEGRVVNAVVDIRRSASELSLREAAVDAAYKARFSKTTREGNQMGTITYHFKQN